MKTPPKEYRILQKGSEKITHLVDADYQALCGVNLMLSKRRPASELTCKMCIDISETMMWKES